MTSAPVEVKTSLPPWADPARAQRNNFDAIRLLLAVLVILSHSHPLVSPMRPEPLTTFFPGYSVGGLAVDGFFILSGYLISQSWIARPAPGPYLVKRIRRIYPGFVAMMCVMLFIVVPIVRISVERFLKGSWLQRWAFTTATLGPYVRPDAFRSLVQRCIVNGSTWTIRFEFLCYLLLAAGMMAGVLRRRWGALAAFIVAFGGWAWLCQRGWIGNALELAFVRDALLRAHVHLRWDGHVDLGTAMLGYVGGVRFVVNFLAGVAFNAWRAAIPRSVWIAAPLAVAWLVAGHWLPVVGAPFLASCLCLPYLLMYLAFAHTPRLHRFARWGDFSYGTYLYAWPIQQMLVWGFPAITPLPLFLAAAPLSVAAGAASWHGVEKHFLRRRHVTPRGP